MRLRRVLLIAVLLFASLALALVFLWPYLPYQAAAARQIKNALAPYGLILKDLKVNSLSNSAARLSDVTTEGIHPLRIKQLQTRYVWQELRHGKLANLTIDGLEATLYQTKDGWMLGGLEGLTAQSKTEKPDFSWMSDSKQLSSMLPQEVILTNSTLILIGNEMEGEFPLSLQLKNATPITLTLETANPQLQKTPYQLSLKQAALTANLTNTHWEGALALDALAIKGTPFPIPVTSGTWPLTLDENSFGATLRMADKAGASRMNGTIRLPLATPEKATLDITRLQFPWANGTIAAEKLRVPLLSPLASPLNLTVKAERVSLATLLPLLTKDKANGTGIISGALPVTYSPDGIITLHPGRAEALEDGTLSIKPDAIPGTGEQMEILRTALQNFHYDSLSLTVESKGDSPVVTLHMEGNNPHALEGRKVHLNISLTGEWMEAIQQSLRSMNDPTLLLKNANP